MGNNQSEFMYCFNIHFIQIISFSIHHLCKKTYLTIAYITSHTTTIEGAICDDFSWKHSKLILNSLQNVKKQQFLWYEVDVLCCTDIYRS